MCNKNLEKNIFRAKIFELNNLCLKPNNNKSNIELKLKFIFFKHELKYFLKYNTTSSVRKGVFKNDRYNNLYAGKSIKYFFD
jgi:hypothetical protein